MESIKIGTRGSRLALWQAHHIQHLLQAKGVESTITIIETKGDKILDVAIAKIGSKGVFTEEIEEQLALGTIDIAVHSAKDMQSRLPKGFELIAFTDREVVNDVLVSHIGDLNLNQAITVGTSSTRRVAMLKHFYPHIKTVPVRGNLQTRIEKMKAGACDALMLAYAGMYRMGYGTMIRAQLPVDKFTPAVGQGSIAVECAVELNDEKKSQIRAAINHYDTEVKLLAERAFLKELEGGCSIPVFGLAVIKNHQLQLEGGIVSLDGTHILRRNIVGAVEQAQQLGTQLAHQILQAGGAKMLGEIKSELKS